MYLQRSKWGGGAGGVGKREEEDAEERDEGEVEGMQRDAFDEPEVQGRGGWAARSSRSLPESTLKSPKI